MITLDLNRQDDCERMQRLAADKATARCDECGCNWEIHRGDAFLCPFCAATFTAAHLSVGGAYIQLEGGGGSLGSWKWPGHAK